MTCVLPYHTDHLPDAPQASSLGHIQLSSGSKESLQGSSARVAW